MNHSQTVDSLLVSLLAWWPADNIPDSCSLRTSMRLTAAVSFIVKQLFVPVSLVLLIVRHFDLNTYIVSRLFFIPPSVTIEHIYELVEFFS